MLSNAAASATEFGLGNYTAKFWYIEIWVEGSGKRNERRGGAGYEAGTCFVALDIWKIPIPNTSATWNIQSRHSRCIVIRVVHSHVLTPAVYSTIATRIP